MPRPTTTGVFHQYLEMIGANEPVTKKARFWSSYVRSLGGIIPRRIYLKCLAIERTNRTDPIVGQDKCKAGQRCAVTEKSCSDDKPAKERVAEQGYHYQPLYRNIYGHSPRKTGLKSIYA